MPLLVPRMKNRLAPARIPVADGTPRRRRPRAAGGSEGGAAPRLGTSADGDGRVARADLERHADAHDMCIMHAKHLGSSRRSCADRRGRAA
jgi:hypothetical protein